MNDDNLRKMVRHMKVFQNISYREIAELLEIQYCSMYSWLEGRYNFSTERKKHLYQIIQDLYFEE